MKSEKKIKKDDLKIQEFIESAGITIQQKGFSPIVARLIAFLLVAKPSYQSFYEIQETLMASKSAVSNAINFLLDKKYVKYVTFKGDRKRYFVLNFDTWIELIKNLGETHKKIRFLIDETIAMKDENDEDNITRLKAIRDLYLMFETEFPLLIEQWQRKIKLKNESN